VPPKSLHGSRRPGTHLDLGRSRIAREVRRRRRRKNASARSSSVRRRAIHDARAPGGVLLGRHTTRYSSLVGLAMHAPERRQPQRNLGGTTLADQAQGRQIGGDAESRRVTPCHGAVEEYDLCSRQLRFDCSSLCCASFLTIGVSASILGVCPRHLPTRFTLTRVVQHA
jgi:hypothetical protein